MADPGDDSHTASFEPIVKSEYMKNEMDCLKIEPVISIPVHQMSSLSALTLSLMQGQLSMHKQEML